MAAGEGRLSAVLQSLLLRIEGIRGLVVGEGGDIYGEEHCIRKGSNPRAVITMHISLVLLMCMLHHDVAYIASGRPIISLMYIIKADHVNSVVYNNNIICCYYTTHCGILRHFT